MSIARRVARAFAERTAVDYSDFEVVWHESPVDGLGRLRAADPSYRGSAGPGVYVSPDGTGGLYGKHVYRCRLRFNPSPSTVFVILPHLDHVEVGHEADSHFNSFGFRIDGTGYWVGGDDSLENHNRMRWFRRFVDRVRYGDEVPWPVEEAELIGDYADGSGHGLPSWSDEIFDDPVEALGIHREFEGYVEAETGLGYEDPGFGDAWSRLKDEVAGQLREMWEDIKRDAPSKYDRAIPLSHLSRVVEDHGYRALYFRGLRTNGVAGGDVELIVFDGDDVEIIEQVK